jgi:peptidoglycan/LPS O-acetylase OafA/YrhL
MLTIQAVTAKSLLRAEPVHRFKSRRKQVLLETDDSARLDYLDGLRAIAVGVVVWFHAALPGMPNGYLGVDIFFVISGFLITAQIFDGVAKGSFSISAFYARRIMRIWPPLFVVIFAVLVASAILPMLPGDMKRIALSAVASTAMLANWYFLQVSDYFAPAAEREPLLHIWSLGVEEQYYLVVPMFVLGLAILARRTNLNLYSVGLACTAAVFVLSLGASLVVTRPSVVFYATPLRAWEFAIGAAAILSIRCGLVPRPLPARLLTLIGLVAIGVGCTVAPADAVQRSLVQLLVVVGAGAVVLCGGFAQGGVATRLLSVRPMVTLGLISYSLYLWHWPLQSLWRLVHLDPPSPLDRVLAGVVAPLVLAVVSYILIEQPIRAWRHRRAPVTARLPAVAKVGAAAVLLALTGLGVVAWSMHLDTTERFRAYAAAANPLMSDCPQGRQEGPPLRCRWSHGRAEPRLLLWGDSHARSMWAAVTDHSERAGLSAQLQWAGQCPPLPGATLHANGSIWAGCMSVNDTTRRWLSSAELKGVTGVVLGASWEYARTLTSPLPGDADGEVRLGQAVSHTVATLRALGLRVLVVGPVPLMPYSGPECLYRSGLAGDLDRCRIDARSVRAGQHKLVEALRSAVMPFDNARFIDPRDALCDQDYCWPGRGGQVHYRDTHHLSDAGARVVGAHFADDFAWVASREQRP